MKSAYRTWIRQKKEGVKSVDLDELCRELQTIPNMFCYINDTSCKCCVGVITRTNAEKALGYVHMYIKIYCDWTTIPIIKNNMLLAKSTFFNVSCVS
ncbi:hypothetical protein Hanom_Chr08g00705421 [Helianthus anomalus]